MLSDDKNRIIAYPAPKDLFTNGKLAYPTALNKGYLMDNRGIGKNVAFTGYTYEEYSRLESVPPIQEIYESIIDKDPLLELCNCGNRNQYTDTKLMNRLIKDGLKKCKNIDL